MSKKVVTFDQPRAWKIADKEVEITKIETNSYYAELKFPKHKDKIDVIHPFTALKNIIKNVALLPNALFIEADNKYVLARINDVVGTTLIKTEWRIKIATFNEMVMRIQLEDPKLKEEFFYLTSKIS